MADADLKVVVQGVDNLSPVLKKMESGVIRFVGAVASTMSAIATLAVPIVKAAEFEREMLSVKKTTDFSSSAIQSLGDDLLNLSSRIDVSAPELAKIAALGGQLGLGATVGSSGLAIFTDEIAKAVTALDVSAEEAGVSLGKLINIFNIPVSDYGNVIAVINQMSNISTARPTELFDIMRRIGNLGESVTVDQSAALSALAIDVGLTAETAGTSLVKIFSNMRSEAVEFSRFMGVSVQEWVDPLVNGRGVEQLKAYLTRLNALPEEVAAAAVEKLSGGGRIGSLVDKLRQQMKRGETSRLDVLLREAALEMERGTSAAKEQESVLSGLAAQWDVLGNRISRVAIKSTQPAIPAFTNLLRNMGDSLSDGATLDRISSAMETVGLVADALASVFERLGGASQVLRLALDFGILAYMTKGFATTKAALNSFTEASAASAQKLIAVEQATKAAIEARSAAAVAAAKVTTIRQERNTARQNVTSLTRDELAATRQRDAALAGSLDKSDPAIAKARSNYAKYLRERRALSATHVTEMAAQDQKYASDKLALESAHEKELKAIKGGGSKARKLLRKSEQQAELAALTQSYTDWVEYLTVQQKAETTAANRRVVLSRTTLASIVAAERAAMANIAETRRIGASSQLPGQRNSALSGNENLASAEEELQGLNDAADEAQLHLNAITAASTGVGAAMQRTFSAGAAATYRWSRSVLGASQTVSRALAVVGGYARVATEAVLGFVAGTLRLFGAGAAVDTLSAKWAALGVQIRAATTATQVFVGWLQRAAAVGAFLGRALTGIFSRLLTLWIAFDIGKWALEAIGALNPVIGYINRAIAAANRLGFSIEKIKTPEEVVAARKAVEEQKALYDKAQAGAESFQAVVGRLSFSTRITVDGGKEFDESLAARAKTLEDFRKQVERGVVFSLDNPLESQAEFTFGADILEKSAKEAEYLKLRIAELTRESKELAAGGADAADELTRLKALRAATAAGAQSGLGTDSLSDVARYDRAIQEILDKQQRELVVRTQIEQSIRAASELEVSRAGMYKAMAGALDKMYVTEVIDSGVIDRLLEMDAAVEAVQAKLSGLVAPSGTDTESAPAREYTKLKESLQDLTAQKDKAEQEFVKLGSVMALSFGKPAGEVARLFKQLGTGEQQLRGFGVTASASGARVLSMFKGLSSSTIATDDQYRSALARFASYSQSVIPVFQTLAAEAKVAAEQAQAAVRQTFDKAKRDALEMQDFVNGVMRNIRAANEEATRAAAARVDAPKKDKELAAVDAELSQRLSSAEARSTNDVDLASAKALWEEFARIKRTEIETRYERDASLRLQKDQITTATEQVAKAEQLGARLSEINGILKDDNAKPAVKQGLVQEYADVQRQVEQLRASVTGLIDDLSRRTDAKGVVAAEGVVVGLAKRAQDAFNGAGRASTEGAQAVADTQIKVAGALSEMAQNAQVELDKLNTGLLVYAQKSGSGYAQVAQDIGRAAAAMQGPIAQLNEEIGRIGQFNILGDRVAETVRNRVASVAVEASAMLKDMRLSISPDVKLPAIDLTPLEARLTNTFLTGLAKASENLKATSVKVTVDKDQLADELNKAASGASIDVAVNVKPGGGGSQPSETSGGAATPRPRFRDGGPVHGPGTSTSDSVLAWLSRTEFVVDGLTHRMFGTGFFRSLQAIAKSGATKPMRMAVRGFAAGGSLSELRSAVSAQALNVVSSVETPAAAPSFANFGRVDLGVGGKTHPVYTTSDVASSLRHAAIKLG